MYILRPHAAGILYAPPFYTPPTPRRVILGVGEWACIKFGPVGSAVKPIHLTYLGGRFGYIFSPWERGKRESEAQSRRRGVGFFY